MTFPLGTLDIDPVAFAIAGNAALGIKDSGKTYGMTYVAEQLYLSGIPFITIDPIGVWRWLRVAGPGPDGRGFPIVVAGGEAGDLDLTPESAPLIVRAAMKNGVSLVLDLFSLSMSKADWRKIVMSTCNLLLYENKAYGLRHIFLEEAAEFVPQVVYDGNVYSAVEKVVRMGGNSSLGITLINPRAEEVNKTVLELCENLFLFRQKGKNTLTSLRKWLAVADVADPKTITDTFSKLPTGECWAWVAMHEQPVRIKVQTKLSFHPNRRAQRGDLAAAGKAVDVGEFVADMRAALAEATAAQNDGSSAKPAASAKTKPAPAGALPAGAAAAIDRAYKDGYDTGSQHAQERGRQAGYAAGVEAGRLAAIARTREIITSIRDQIDGIFDVHLNQAASQHGDAAPSEIPAIAEAPARRRPVTATPHISGRLPGAAGKLLAAMDTNPPVSRTWGQFAALAGIKARGGHFLTGRRHLIDAGLAIESGGLVSIAKPSANAQKPSSDPAANVDMWAGVLRACAPQIIRYLFEVGGSARRQDIADALGLKPSGGHWLTGWKQLRDNDIVAMSGDVATLTELFRPKSRRRAA